METGKKLIRLTLFLFIASIVIILYDWYSLKSIESEKVKGFQHLAGGLGLGASINPRWGFISFDARVDNIEETNLFPVPGGYIYSPDRGSSVSEFKEAN